MNNRGQILIVDSVWPPIIAVIYIFILAQLIPNIESFGILGFIAIIISTLLVTFIFGIVLPTEIGIYLNSKAKK
jgi:hypothetical protein